MEMTLKTEQIKILEDFFASLGTMDQRKIFTSGFKKAARPLLRAMRANVPVNTGRLRRSLASVMLPNDISIIVGARTVGLNKGWYGHLVEYGTVDRIRKSGGRTGKVTGTHFVERAFYSTEKQVYGSIEDEWYNAIDRFIIRTNKKLI
jgi:HK97 gp10 family phage protein